MDANPTPPFDPSNLPPALIGHMEPDYEALADAVYWSEGGPKTKHPYGIMIPTKDEFQARRYAINTFRNNFKRWEEDDKKWKDGKPITYFEYLARTYTPPSKDPVGHTNWLINVPSIYSQYVTKDQPSIDPKQEYAPTNLPKYKAP